MAKTKSTPSNSPQNRKALFQAARQAIMVGNAKVLRQALKAGINPNADKGELLAFAVDMGRAEAVRILLKNGADPNQGAPPPLEMGPSAKQTEILLKAGADPRANDSAAFRRAATRNELETARLLLEAGADPDALDGEALRHCRAIGATEMADLLLKHGADPSAGVLPLEKAAAEGDIGAMRAALADGADPNAICVNRWPVLLNAAIAGQHMAVDYLASRGADLHTAEEAPLRHAAKHGQAEMVRVLLARGADVHIHNDRPLRLAAENNHPEAVRALAEGGADLDAKKGEALVAAARAENLPMVELLLELGADPSLAVNALAPTPRQIATGRSPRPAKTAKSNILKALFRALDDREGER